MEWKEFFKPTLIKSMIFSYFVIGLIYWFFFAPSRTLPVLVNIWEFLFLPSFLINFASLIVYLPFGLITKIKAPDFIIFSLSIIVSWILICSFAYGKKKVASSKK